MTNWLLCHLPFRQFFTSAVAAAAAIELSWHCRSGSGARARAPAPLSNRPSVLYPRTESERGRGSERESDVRLSVSPPPRRASPHLFLLPFAFVFSRLLLIARHQLHLASIRPPPPSLSQRRRGALPRRQRRRQPRRRSNSPFSVLVDMFRERKRERERESGRGRPGVREGASDSFGVGLTEEVGTRVSHIRLLSDCTDGFYSLRMNINVDYKGWQYNSIQSAGRS